MVDLFIITFAKLVWLVFVPIVGIIALFKCVKDDWDD